MSDMLSTTRIEELLDYATTYGEFDENTPIGTPSESGLGTPMDETRRNAILVYKELLARRRAELEPRQADEPLPTAFEKSAKKQTSSNGRFMGRSVIYGKEDEAAIPYAVRYWIGRLRLHIFYRGDQDPDCHDHPWDFWTFPLTSYVEEVAYANGGIIRGDGKTECSWQKLRQVVPAWRLTFRPAEHKHRVLGRYSGQVVVPSFGDSFRVGARKANSLPSDRFTPIVAPGRVVTIVWRGPKRRDWGFLKNRDGKWCWVAWADYVFGGGKGAPCE